MKLKFVCLVLSVNFFAPVPGMAVDYDREVAQITAQYEKAVTEATYPITQRYKSALNELLKKATQAGDLDAAVKIQKLLSGMEGKAIVGTWVRSSGASLEFTNGGNYHANWTGGTGDEGKWRATSEKDFEVTAKSQGVVKFRINEGGKSITRLTDNFVWTKKE